MLYTLSRSLTILASGEEFSSYSNHNSLISWAAILKYEIKIC